MTRTQTQLRVLQFGGQKGFSHAVMTKQRPIWQAQASGLHIALASLGAHLDGSSPNLEPHFSALWSLTFENHLPYQLSVPREALVFTARVPVSAITQQALSLNQR